MLEALALILLAVLFGYVSGDDPGHQPGNAFRFLISVVPIIFLVLSWLLSRRISFEDAGVSGSEDTGA